MLPLLVYVDGVLIGAVKSFDKESGIVIRYTLEKTAEGEYKTDDRGECVTEMLVGDVTVTP